MNPMMFPTTPIEEAQYQLGFGFGGVARKAARALLEKHDAQLFTLAVPGVKEPAVCVDTADLARILAHYRQPIEPPALDQAKRGRGRPRKDAA